MQPTRNLPIVFLLLRLIAIVMDRFAHFFKKHATGKKVLLLFLVTNAIYLFMLLVTIPLTMEFSNGMKLLDMMPTGYDRSYVNELFGSLGVQGREAYLTKQIPVDMIYPLLFGLSYSLLLAYFLKRLNRFRAPLIYLCTLPLIAGLADYFENLGIISMLRSYPELKDFAAQATNFFSLLKSGFTTAFFLVLIAVLAWVGVRALFSKKVKLKVDLEKPV